MSLDGNTPNKRPRNDRVAAACDLCKARKVKCNGNLPCEYCIKRNRAAVCTFTAPRERNSTRVHESRPPSQRRGPSQHSSPSEHARSQRTHGDGLDDHRDTAVPLEARLLCDNQGKMIFIGDCAPMSFLQTVRHLVATHVDPTDVPSARDSVLEWAPPSSIDGAQPDTSLLIDGPSVSTYVAAYRIATDSLLDLFGTRDLEHEISQAVSDFQNSDRTLLTSVYMLVLAIGAQQHGDCRAETWFDCSKSYLVQHMCDNMNIGTIQGFTLIAIYLLHASQPNAAYVYFALAARTAYAIGIHRTEVNASFGEAMGQLRDRLWKSLRIVDIWISCLLGRPTATSDVDCTVSYTVKSNPTDGLAASVQIFMIIERIVVEVYSRKRISLRIADFVSRQLRGWAAEHLEWLTELSTAKGDEKGRSVGASQTLCLYFYAIMLLTRPFLIYDIYEHLGQSLRSSGTRTENERKKRFADSAIDAAMMFVDVVETLRNDYGALGRMPLVASWLFTTGLVLAIGMLNNDGLGLQKYCAKTTILLQMLGTSDPAARQYKNIVQALSSSISIFVDEQHSRLRDRRRLASSQLFGVSHQSTGEAQTSSNLAARSESTIPDTSIGESTLADSELMRPRDVADWTIYDADFFAMPWPIENDSSLQDFLQPSRLAIDGALADIPLFPIYEQGITPDGLLYQS